VLERLALHFEQRLRIRMGFIKHCIGCGNFFYCDAA
jgi:hypothetical protein